MPRYRLYYQVSACFADKSAVVSPSGSGAAALAAMRSMVPRPRLVMTWTSSLASPAARAALTAGSRSAVTASYRLRQDRSTARAASALSVLMPHMIRHVVRHAVHKSGILGA